MANNEIEAVNSDVIDFVLEEFTPKEEVPNELIAEVIDNLEAELEKVIG
jgi:peptidyl-tRNA hydrolase